MGWIMAWVFLLLLTGLVVLFLRGPGLPAEFDRILASEVASDALRPHPLVTEANLAGLPAPVQRYIRLSGALGKPRPASLTVTYDAKMYAKPGAAPMTGVAVQYDRFDPPKRLFYMASQMMGLPVKVLHDYDGTEATMRVRLAGLVSVVDAGGATFSKIETVTLLNDLCLFAPAWLTDPRLTWTALDDLSAAVTFRNGPHVVSAVLYFNAAGELVDFSSYDRGEVQRNGVPKMRPWSTPVRDYRDLGRQRVMTYGEAIWKEPEGDFTYGKFAVTAFETR
jgi:hypothetical protein